MNRKNSGFLDTAMLIFVDAVMLAASVMLSIVLFETRQVGEASEYIKNIVLGIPILVLTYTVISYCAQMYRIIWKYAGLKDVLKHVIINAFSWLVFFAIHEAIHYSFKRIVTYVGGIVISECLIMTVRFIIRLWSRTHSTVEAEIPDTHGASAGNPVMIIGGGNAAYMIIHDLKNNPSLVDHNVTCIIDDSPGKQGKLIYGVPVVGDSSTIKENVKKYNIETIIFAIPSCPKDRKASILDICSSTGKTVKILPTLYLANGEISADVRKIRKIHINDLLERDPITADMSSIRSFINGKTVLVTGGGGSIGSELCRQLCEFKPKKLVVFDIYENNAYDIQNELKRKFPDQDLEVMIGSVRDEKRLDQVFDRFRPDVVYHAAAHKHVPLMEDSPNESIKNNVFGTYNTAKAADKYGASRFVLISTDKAVNPTNIMGASKRICEMIIQSFDKKSKTAFVAVRFGNVLGSNGSVVPLFQKQIDKGGPVTVTHPDIIRYFMTIPEAVLLVLQAGAFANGGEIFILDMGNPVRILDLAEKMIRLSGYEPYKDIRIDFVGLRPGEKLYEELLIAEEGIAETPNEMIFIGHPIKFDEDEFFKSLDTLGQMMEDDSADIRSMVKTIVPNYTPKDNKDNITN